MLKRCTRCSFKAEIKFEEFMGMRRIEYGCPECKREVNYELSEEESKDIYVVKDYAEKVSSNFRVPEVE